MADCDQVAGAEGTFEYTWLLSIVLKGRASSLYALEPVICTKKIAVDNKLVSTGIAAIAGHERLPRE